MSGGGPAGLPGSAGQSGGPLFQHSDGRPLTKAAFVDQVRKTLALAGVDERNYAGHSFRIGAATTAAAAEVDHIQK